MYIFTKFVVLPPNLSEFVCEGRSTQFLLTFSREMLHFWQILPACIYNMVFPTASSRHHRQASSDSRSPISTEMYTAVAMRDGTTRSLVLERPRQKLNAKLKPEVVVKRKGGRFEAGQLTFVGVLDGKEMAGVVLHLASMFDYTHFSHTHAYAHAHTHTHVEYNIAVHHFMLVGALSKAFLFSLSHSW